MSSIHKEQRVCVFVDVQNMYYSARNLYGAKINFTHLLKHAVKRRKLIRAIAYVIRTEKFEEKSFFDALETIGYEIKAKGLKTYYDGTKKGDWDMGIAIDAIKMVNKMDVAVIITGDGDFRVLVEHLKALGVRVEIMAFGKSTAKELREEADFFIDLDRRKKEYLI